MHVCVFVCMCACACACILTHGCMDIRHLPDVDEKNMFMEAVSQVIGSNAVAAQASMPHAVGPRLAVLVCLLMHA